MIDAGSQFGARADRRLREEVLAWLVTVRADGQPQPSPVWFLWDGESFLVYSQAGRQKVRNIERNPLVSLHLDGDGRDLYHFGMSPHAHHASCLVGYRNGRYRKRHHYGNRGSKPHCSWLCLWAHHRLRCNNHREWLLFYRRFYRRAFCTFS